MTNKIYEFRIRQALFRVLNKNFSNEVAKKQHESIFIEHNLEISLIYFGACYSEQRKVEVTAQVMAELYKLNPDIVLYIHNLDYCPKWCKDGAYAQLSPEHKLMVDL